MYMDKQKLAKLASLNNAAANSFLLDFALTKKIEIKAYKTNDEIIEALDYFSAIFYRVPKVVLDVCVEILYRKRGIKAQKMQHGFIGTDWSAVQVKALELLKNIRYYELKESIRVAFDFTSHIDQSVKSTALKLVEEIAEYNYQALPHVGILPQKYLLSFIQKHTFKEGFENDLNPLKIAIEKMLSTSADATILTAPDTLTLRKGDLKPGDDLKNLRMKIIKLIFVIYKKSKKNSTKNLVVYLLAYACHFPDNSERTSPIGLVVKENREYIISGLDKLIFDKRGNLNAPLSFCLEVEHLLFWHFIFHKQQNDVAQPLYDKLIKNSLYHKFSKFVHDDSLKFEVGSGEYKKQNGSDINEYIDHINDIDFKHISSELNLFASDTDVIGEWKFRNLQALFEKLGTSNPEISATLVQDAIKHKKPLSVQIFLAFLLRGIRLSEKYEIWDKIVEIIIKTKNSDFIGSVPASLHIYTDTATEPILRKKDLTLLSDLTSRKNSFSFLVTKDHSRNVNFSTINALRAVYYLNPIKIQNLIIAELKSGPHYLENYLNTLSIYSGKEGGIDFSLWSVKNKKFIVNKIIEIPTIDWHVDSLIKNLYSDPIDIIKIFTARIKKESQIDKSQVNYFSRRDRYEAVPYYMNNDLVDYVVSHKNYLSIVPEIIKSFKNKDFTRRYDLAKLGKHFKVPPYLFLEALSINGKVTDKTIKDTISIIDSFGGIDTELAIKLASYTSNKNVLSTISNMLHNTGVVSGQYGIADYYASRQYELEKFKEDNNPNIREFVIMSIESLQSSEERARKDADQDKEKRRIDFDTNL